MFFPDVFSQGGISLRQIINPIYDPIYNPIDPIYNFIYSPIDPILG